MRKIKIRVYFMMASFCFIFLGIQDGPSVPSEGYPEQIPKGANGPSEIM